MPGFHISHYDRIISKKLFNKNATPTFLRSLGHHFTLNKAFNVHVSVSFMIHDQIIPGIWLYPASGWVCGAYVNRANNQLIELSLSGSLWLVLVNSIKM